MLNPHEHHHRMWTSIFPIEERMDDALSRMTLEEESL